MDAKELKALSIDLMDAVRQRNLSAFSLKCEDFQIRIEAQQAPVAIAAPAVAVAAPAAATAPQAQPAAASPVEESFSGTPVEAPLVGIFYSAPAPEEDVYKRQIWCLLVYLPVQLSVGFLQKALQEAPRITTTKKDTVLVSFFSFTKGGRPCASASPQLVFIHSRSKKPLTGLPPSASRPSRFSSRCV